MNNICNKYSHVVTSGVLVTSRSSFAIRAGLHFAAGTQAPDGSLDIAESVKGKIWRVIYTGK